jgi:hypothetical protein
MSDLLEYISKRTRWEGDCLVFTNICNQDGYAIAPLKRFLDLYKTKYIHRMVYMHHNNIILKPDECILHSCDNPPCMNLSHLRVGSRLDNARDRDSRGRQADKRGIKSPTAKLTEEQIYFIRRTKGVFAPLLIADVFNIHRDTISDIRRFKTWSHLQ